MKIVSLHAENVKRLRAVTIEPQGSSVVLIKGQNGQGKTSVIDSIELALGGKNTQPPKVIREGEENAVVVLDLGDLVVKRRWTSNEKSYLEVKSKDGAKYSSPQAMLDKLVGSLSFDPLAFVRLEPKAQVETLRKLVGLDFTELERARQAAYEERTAVNRELTQAKSRFVAMPVIDGVPEKEVSIQDLLNEQQKLIAEKTENDRMRSDHQTSRRRLQELRTLTVQYEEQVELRRKQLAEAEQMLASNRALVTAREQEVAFVEEAIKSIEDPDVAAITDQIRNLESTNAKVRQSKARAVLADQVKALEDKTAQLTTRISTLETGKQELLAGAKFPVPGLSFTPEGVTFKGLPIQQASAAEQLRVSLAMGLALNPELKVVLIRDGSLLDDNSLRLVAEMAGAAQAQVWVERVSDKDPIGILIEDGEVKRVDEGNLLADR